MFAGSRLLLPVSTNFITLVPKPGRKEGHAVREPSLLRGIAVLRRSGSRKKRRPPVAARGGGAGAMEEQEHGSEPSVPPALPLLQHWRSPLLSAARSPQHPSRTTAAHKTQTKIQAWSSLVFHCRHSSFNPSEAPPWDSRPVSDAGVVHYHLLHRPRSVPTALGPAPLATPINVKVTCGQGHPYSEFVLCI